MEAVAAVISSVLALIGPDAVAHACPIAPDRALTSRHVAIEERRQELPRPRSFIWATEDETGSAWVLDYDLRRDLALLALEPASAQAFAVAQDPPLPGARVTALAYGPDMRRREVRTRVLHVIGAHLILEERGAPGMSGSCVIDGEGRVVGVWQWSVEFGGRARGVASGVWGRWVDVGWVPPK